MATNTEVQHNSSVMQRVYKFYNDQKFTDILFEFPFTSYTFTAHRLILSAASPYLYELFDNVESDCSSVTITSMDSDTFEQLVIYCYNGKPDITAGNAERMLRGAVLLKLDGVIEVCVSYMMDHIDNFLVRKLIALEAEIGCKPLETPLLEYIAKHFRTLSQTRELRDITSVQWKVIINKINKNEVSQADLFWAIKRWYEYSSSAHQQQLPDVIGSLILTEFDSDFILEQIKPLPGCEKLANEILKKKSAMVTWLAIQVWDEEWLGRKHILRFDQAKEEFVKTIFLEIKRYVFSTAFVEDTLYFVGGQSVFGIIAEVQSYNLRTKELSTKAKMHDRRTAFCMIAWGRYIYAFGGIDQRRADLNSVERYDTSTNSWEYVANMPSKRHSAGITFYNGEIYIIGGKTDVVSQTTVECYNPATNKWRSCKSMLQTRGSTAVTVHQEYIYAIGRNNGDFRTIERYDPKRNEWNMITSLNVSRSYMCAVSIGDQLFALGGVSGSQKMNDTVEVYDMENDKWLIKQKLPVTGMYQCLSVPTSLAEKL